MPTIATATVIGHLYGPAEIKEGKHGKYARVRLWTSDKIKDQEEKQFTSWGGIVSGPQAEWLARDGIKGSLVFVSGTVRMDKFAKSDGTVSHSIEFVRVSECRVLDAKKSEPQADRPAPSRPAQAPAAGGSGDDEPPFARHEDWSW